MNESVICYWNALHYADFSSRIFREIAAFCKKTFAHQLQTGNGYWVFSVNSPRSIFQMKLSSLLNILSLTEWCLTLLCELWPRRASDEPTVFPVPLAITETEAGSGSSVISKWLPLPVMSLVKLWEWDLTAGWAFSVLLCEAKLCRLGRDGSKLEKLWWLLRGHSYITYAIFWSTSTFSRVFWSNFFLLYLLKMSRSSMKISSKCNVEK